MTPPATTESDTPQTARTTRIARTSSTPDQEKDRRDIARDTNADMRANAGNRLLVSYG